MKNRITIIAAIVSNHKNNRVPVNAFHDLPEIDDRAPADFLLSRQRELAQIRAQEESESAEQFDSLFGAYER